ncbi:MAG: tRNA (N(6)-L-threonylcarbamoyladenosine(37)-C(2))-methylthiotransferase MtaB, partial [Alistipes sp.]|nr:tRNA (N(6)-L-threonylcarbamoyladenosine(37)-C(2))-methylthiotransferase MtaB [Alistipes sp.]
GEDDAEFARTYDFLSDIRPSFLHIFPFSERPGTPAVDMPGKVQASVATDRVKALEELCERLHAEFCSRYVGSEADVLFESTMRGGLMFGYTENYLRVCAPYDRQRINSICRVKLVEMKENHDIAAEIIG